MVADHQRHRLARHHRERLSPPSPRPAPCDRRRARAGPRAGWPARHRRRAACAWQLWLAKRASVASCNRLDGGATATDAAAALAAPRRGAGAPTIRGERGPWPRCAVRAPPGRVSGTRIRRSAALSPAAWRRQWPAKGGARHAEPRHPATRRVAMRRRSYGWQHAATPPAAPYPAAAGAQLRSPRTSPAMRKVRMVEKNMPPATAIPSGRALAAGAGPERDRNDADDGGQRGHQNRPESGARGLERRPDQPLPLGRSWLANSTIRIEFFVTRPTTSPARSR